MINVDIWSAESDIQEGLEVVHSISYVVLVVAHISVDKVPQSHSSSTPAL